MKKIERADFVRKRLAKMYPKPKPPLNLQPLHTFNCSSPERSVHHERVNIVTKDLFKKASTPKNAFRRTKSLKPLVLDCPKKSKAIFQPQKY